MFPFLTLLWSRDSCCWSMSKDVTLSKCWLCSMSVFIYCQVFADAPCTSAWKQTRVGPASKINYALPAAPICLAGWGGGVANIPDSWKHVRSFLPAPAASLSLSRKADIDLSIFDWCQLPIKYLSLHLIGAGKFDYRRLGWKRCRKINTLFPSHFMGYTHCLLFFL